MSGGPLWTYYGGTGQHKVRGIAISIFSGLFDDSNRAVKIRSSAMNFVKTNIGYDP